MILIGLTGGIGSGKTTIAKMFESLGCKLYNSDDRAKTLYFKPEVKSKIINLLGEKVYISDTEIDKDAIFDIVFNDPNKLKSMNEIFVPYVEEDFKAFLATCDASDVIIKESAILFETSMHKDLNCNIIVVAPKETRIKRVMKRNDVSREKVEQCIKAQWTDDKKIPLSDFIINNSDCDSAEYEVEHIMSMFKNDSQVEECLKPMLDYNLKFMPRGIAGYNYIIKDVFEYTDRFMTDLKKSLSDIDNTGHKSRVEILFWANGTSQIAFAHSKQSDISTIEELEISFKKAVDIAIELSPLKELRTPITIYHFHLRVLTFEDSLQF